MESLLEKQEKKKPKTPFIKRSLEQRIALFQRQIAKHPDSAPTVVQLIQNNIKVYETISTPRKLTVNEFRIKLNSKFSLKNKDKSSLLRVSNKSLFLNNSSLISTIYDEHKQKDGWLYLSLQPLSFF